MSGWSSPVSIVLRRAHLNKFPDEYKGVFTERAVAEGWSVKRIKEERRRLDPRKGKYVKGEFDAIKFVRDRGIDKLFISHWELIGKHVGSPGPFRCEFSVTSTA